ncbi:2-keto-3-deoxy-L-rhamnonate aldolase [Roseovarius albus]|uniref:Hydroxypyruvate/pyruvate aldolase n=1 Tax=Roseovarius albus TaxID=1247867 RepID=A0A1X6ZV61_9RHOB|nr:HpcH/HpaI aldolase/citrate lyase family protein [Roseovarius albus]SLN62100.1 2-keto-3-deoxy-L-rhamnonate aldolase [Roseovarius albus]
MPAPTNTFKQNILAGIRQMGCWVGLAHPYAAEIAGTAGFDWLLIDGEHAPNDLRSISEQIAVLQASDSTVVVRLPNDDTALIKQTLDAGAQTLLIPMVESADQARELVRAVRYPPHGIRGVGYALARASQFAAIPDYFATADKEICLLVQVESKAGLDALDDILAVEGVDGVFIGPADLSVDLGYAPSADAPEIRAIVLDAIDRIAATDKAAGILTLDPEFIAECLAYKATFVAVGIDVLTLAGGLRDLAKNARKAADEL